MGCGDRIHERILQDTKGYKEMTWDEARLQVAAWIRAGDPLLEESHAIYLSIGTEPCGCALGTAWVGKIGRVDDVPGTRMIGGTLERLLQAMPEMRVRVPANIINELRTIPHLPWLRSDDTLANVIETLHCSDMPRLAIADWLESGVLATVRKAVKQ